MEFIKSYIKKKFTLQQIALLVLFFVTLRVLIELLLLDYPIELDIFQHYARFYLENVYYFIILLFLVSFLFSKLLGKDMLDIINFAIKFFPIIILPPIIDYFFFNIKEGYNYATIENFLNNFLTLSLIKGDASPGITFEVISVFIFVCVYVFYIKRSLLLSIFSGFLTSLIVVIISTPDLFFGKGMGDYYYDFFLPIYYFFPLLFLSALLCYYYKKEKLKAVLSNLRLIKSLMFIIVVTLGSLAAISFDYKFDLYKIFLAAIIPFFGWQFSIVINDIYDYNIDKISNKTRPLVKKILTKEEYKFVAWIFAFFALSFSAILSIQIFLITILALILGIIYSVPPIRLRKYIIGNLVIGTSLIITFIIGLLIPNDPSVLFYNKNLVFITLLFLFGTIVTFTKDIKDIKSDSKYGIKNFYTVYGKKRGKKIIIILLFLVQNLPILLLKKITIWPITLLISFLTCYLYYRKEDEKIVYFISALLLVLIFIRLYFPSIGY